LCVVEAIDARRSAEREPIAMVTNGVRSRASRRLVTAIAASAIVVLASGGVFAGRRYLMPAPPAAPLPPPAGRLAITTSPDGARVIVDGEPRGVSPLNLTVSPGVHMLELHGEGDPRRVSVTVNAGAEVSQYIELPKGAPLYGNLQVKSEPTGARVTIDGVPRGVSPLTIAGLTPGEHSLQVASDAGTATQTVEIDPGVTASVMAQLSNQGAPASGWISVSAPQEVQLFEDGHLIGSSQSDKVMVLAGSHQLTLVNQLIGYRGTKTVQVRPGKTATIKVELPDGMIAVNATPWAEVWIDGTRIGETPIGNLPIPVGSHDIVFRHPELGEQKHVAMVTLNASTRLSVDMRKR
jgi:hypothetical protein